MFNKSLRKREKECRELFYEFPSYKHTINHVIWFHAASMGEFEQAKPLIEMIKARNENIKIVVTFFSPSGYNNQKKYKFADHILYLPLDTKQNVKQFIDKVNPKLVVFIRYEIWHNYLSELKNRSITTILLCATKPTNKKLYENSLMRKFTSKNYDAFTKIYTVGKEHTEFFKGLDLTNEIETAADIRFDRILGIIHEARITPIIPRNLFGDEDIVLVAGSTWTPDEDLILNGIKLLNEEQQRRLRLIIVPHEPTEKHLSTLLCKLEKSILLSKLEKLIDNEDKETIKSQLAGAVVVVDSIGKLLRLYATADIAYIGGAFGVGVHSVTEPAGYAIPLAVGDNYANSPDAINLRSLNALKSLKNENEFAEWINEMQDKDNRTKTGQIAFDYINQGSGWTERIYKELFF